MKTKFIRLFFEKKCRYIQDQFAMEQNFVFICIISLYFFSIKMYKKIPYPQSIFILLRAFFNWSIYFIPLITFLVGCLLLLQEGNFPYTKEVQKFKAIVNVFLSLPNVERNAPWVRVLRLEQKQRISGGRAPILWESTPAALCSPFPIHHGGFQIGFAVTQGANPGWKSTTREKESRPDDYLKFNTFASARPAGAAFSAAERKKPLPTPFRGVSFCIIFAKKRVKVRMSCCVAVGQMVRRVLPHAPSS